jgi:hypothetical protein
MACTQTMMISYEQQLDSRTCGAAALCMVYRSFGLACTQSEVWRRIARPGPWNLERSNTRLLCADALSFGLAAIILKARDPWRVLELSVSRDIPVILNHRSALKSRAGHYSVLAGLKGGDVVLHDPHVGPFRDLARAELLELWRADVGRSEITGLVLVAFTNAQDGALDCELCGAPIPQFVPCVNCERAIPLYPAAVLGCARATCRARTWERIHCPHCDMGLNDLSDRHTGVQSWNQFANFLFFERGRS